MKRQRLTRSDNRERIDEREGIFVPGTRFFDNDFLYRWLEANLQGDVNISLLFHKYPGWFKSYDHQGALAKISLSHDFGVPKDKRNLDNDRDWKNDTHDYKREHLEHIHDLSCHLPTNYDELKKRHFGDHSRDGFVRETRTRLLIGFAGTGTVFENSLSLHPFYGFPVIPGSSIKGLVRSYCRDTGVDPGEILNIFGNESENANEEAVEGQVVFMDAWPEEGGGRGLLELDVMTPHYSKYYGGNILPSDSDNPIPIVFLAVPPCVKFRFCLLPARRCRDASLVGKTEGYLVSALQDYGIGAKTGSSYGYFKKVKGIG